MPQNTRMPSNSIVYCTLYTILPITHIRLLVRIKADDPTAVHPLGSKFGCSVSEACTLLEAAKELKLEIVGVWYVHTTHFAEFCYQAADVLALMKFYCLVFLWQFSCRVWLTES